MSRDTSGDSGYDHVAGEGVGSRSSFEQYNADEYRESLKEKADHLITKGFPEKIAKLNEVLATSNLQNRDLAHLHQELNFPEPPPADGVFTVCNQPLKDLVDLIKPYIWELREDSNLLKMWIALMIPKTEDGNNFGVSIQLGTLDFVQSVESKTNAYLERISSYFMRRANMLAKVAKYPNIEDYRRAVRELDEQTYLALWRMMREIRNLYCLVHDNVIKNLEKIRKPRNMYSDTLY